VLILTREPHTHPNSRPFLPSGQANHFNRYAPEDVPYAKKRYTTETVRLYEVLESRLEGRDWLVGSGKGQYSLADLNAYPWVQWYRWAGLKDEQVGPNVKAWVKRNLDREAVHKGMYAPSGKNE
jgi:glutathione S-transferase